MTRIYCVFQIKERILIAYLNVEVQRFATNNNIMYLGEIIYMRKFQSGIFLIFINFENKRIIMDETRAE